jgi:2-polyprenyl-6-methoxyphenol hydroxylase-like FAD-dependent oxidoreductase
MSAQEPAILICGAGIAGIAFANLLARKGLRPTVIERSERLRSAGNAVDLRGPAVDIVQSMGILPELQARATQLSDFYRIDALGQRVFTMAPEVIGGDIEILRTELNTALFEATQHGVEYRFGDSIRSMTEQPDRVEVTFDSGLRGEFALVIGADGLHSRTRTLAFGPETAYVQHLGCYQAHFTTDNILGLRRAGLLLNRPGRTVGCYTVHDDREIVVGLFFDSPPLQYDRSDIAAQKRAVAAKFADMGWRTEELLAAMQNCDDFYFDAVAQISMAAFHRGRVALLGDAAYSPSLLSGMGATLAVVGAAILADEIDCHPDDHTSAFERYRSRATDMITFSHELAQASRGWFIQASEASGHLSEARLPADIESDVLRAKALDAASAAVSPR